MSGSSCIRHQAWARTGKQIQLPKTTDVAWSCQILNLNFHLTFRLQVPWRFTGWGKRERLRLVPWQTPKISCWVSLYLVLLPNQEINLIENFTPDKKGLQSYSWLSREFPKLVAVRKTKHQKQKTITEAENSRLRNKFTISWRFMFTYIYIHKIKMEIFRIHHLSTEKENNMKT